MSVRSGTEDCIRKSHLVLRYPRARFGVAELVSRDLFSWPRASRKPRRFLSEKPGGFERYKTDRLRPELHALVAAWQKGAAPEAVVQRLAATALEIMTQKAGRSSVSEPRP